MLLDEAGARLLVLKLAEPALFKLEQAIKALVQSLDGSLVHAESDYQHGKAQQGNHHEAGLKIRQGEAALVEDGERVLQGDPSDLADSWFAN